MSKLVESEKLVAEIVARLAANGVAVDTLSASEFFETPSGDEAKLFEDAITWLSSEKVIRESEAVPDDARADIWHHSVVLTSLGYSKLATDFEVGLKLGNAIKEVSLTGKGYAVAGEFIGGILGGFTKSLSS